MEKIRYYLKATVIAVLLEIEGLWSLFDKTTQTFKTTNMDWINILQILAVSTIVLYVAYKLRKFENTSSLYEAIFLHSVYESAPINRSSSKSGNMDSVADAVKINKLESAKEEVKHMLLTVRPSLSSMEAEKLVSNFYDKQIKKLQEIQKKHSH